MGVGWSPKINGWWHPVHKFEMRPGGVPNLLCFSLWSTSGWQLPWNCWPRSWQQNHKEPLDLGEHRTRQNWSHVLDTWIYEITKYCFCCNELLPAWDDYWSNSWYIFGGYVWCCLDRPVPTGTCFFANLKVPRWPRWPRCPSQLRSAWWWSQLRRGCRSPWASSRPVGVNLSAAHMLHTLCSISKTFPKHSQDIPSPFGSIWIHLAVTIPSSVP